MTPVQLANRASEFLVERYGECRVRRRRLLHIAAYCLRHSPDVAEAWRDTRILAAWYHVKSMIARNDKRSYGIRTDEDLREYQAESKRLYALLADIRNLKEGE